MVIFVGTVILAALFVITSVLANYVASSSDTQAINPDWQESLAWMANNTPDYGCELLCDL